LAEPIVVTTASAPRPAKIKRFIQNLCYCGPPQ
jgi:hypothetical protein